MKKIKFLIMTLAILFSIGASFATTRTFRQACDGATQYYQIGPGGGFVLAGKFGVDYLCVNSSETCTWYTVDLGHHYLPCREGAYCTSNCLTGKSQSKKSGK